MRILLTGATGGIGSAIKRMLEMENEVLTLAAPFNSSTEFPENIEWLICAHGIIDEYRILQTFIANVTSQIYIAEQVKAANIIFISSTAGIRGNDRFPVYAASKAALNMYCKSVARRQPCYAICPGPTDTKLWRRLGLEGQAQSPLEVAKAVQQVIEGKFKSGDIITVRNGVIV